MNSRNNLTARNRVLLVDDDPGQANTLADCLDMEDIDTRICMTGSEAIEMCRLESFYVAIIDLRLPDIDGLDLLSKLREISPDIQVIIHTGHATLESAMEAVNVEAFAYIEKMDDPQKLINHVQNAFIQRYKSYSNRLRAEIDQHKQTHQELSETHQELHERHEEMEAELLMAREIQHSLIPNNYPHFPQDQPETEAFLRFAHRYQPSSTLAGDFFFMVPVSNTRAGLFICDVMGHGIRAALITALLRGLIEEMKPMASKPDAFLDEINTGLYRIFSQSSSCIFVTSCYLVVDILQRKIVYANAGHPPPMLIRRSEGILVPLRPKDNDPEIALGLAGDVEYSLQEVPLVKDDGILLYTDGFYEAENPQNTQLGIHGFQDMILKTINKPISTILDNLILSLEEYCEQSEFGDDVCLFGMDLIR
jgi:serine phosphatase RsbU (regulator of sigma subunit)